MSRALGVVALAGRRIDAPDAPIPTFPPDAVPRVRARLDGLLAGASHLVCAAACGSDILALESAAALGIPSRIVLPFDVATFRAGSVADRPGDWGERYDAIVAAAAAAGALAIVPPPPFAAPYAAANRAILDEARKLAGRQPLTAVAVWDGPRNNGTDYTADFVEAAHEIGATGIAVPISA